jgi:hypothetical protein
LQTVDDVLSIKLGIMNTYNPNKYCDIDDKDDQNMEVGFNTIQAGEHHRYNISTVTCCHGWGMS